MDSYWFADWIKKKGVKDEKSLRTVLSTPRELDAFLEVAPEPVFKVRAEPPKDVELTGGKGIDLTGELGCGDIDCIKKEMDGLFRYVWHYFDRVTLPDQALVRVIDFKHTKNVDGLIRRLATFVLALNHLQKIGGTDLVEFEVRTPSCEDHLDQHADEAQIKQAIPNRAVVASELVTAAVMKWKESEQDGHHHLEYQLVHPAFEHTEWGILCSAAQPLPKGEPEMRQAIAEAVVRRYLAALSADALAARRAKSALGATIPFYRRLLGQQPAQGIADVAFELALPIADGLSTTRLIKMRRDEEPAFQRFRTAIRTAIRERLNSAESTTATKLADEIKADVIDPELRNIRDKLAATTAMANKSGLTGLALGSTAAIVGLLSIGGPIGAGVAVAGAMTLGAASLKKAKDDLLAVRREVALSDMYFLWKAHQH